jgi:hypothetical protein
MLSQIDTVHLAYALHVSELREDVEKYSKERLALVDTEWKDTLQKQIETFRKGIA